ncbi:MAG: hypothetical protein WC799_18295 [Desulfobacteraceae bacterium]|jgi:hypothetical protein
MIIKKQFFDLFIFFSILVGSCQFSSASETIISNNCHEAVITFLTHPTKRTLAALSVTKDNDCWNITVRTQENESFNKYFKKLIELVGNGNRWAAVYLIEHLKNLDGGDLEDSYIALGKFSDHEFEYLLLFVKNKQLHIDQLTDALTMLPLSVSDNPQAQLTILYSRIKEAIRVTRKDLMKEKIHALKAMNDFKTEILSNMPVKKRCSKQAR